MATSSESLHAEHAAWFRHPLTSAMLALFWGCVLIVGVVSLSGQAGLGGEARAAEPEPDAQLEPTTP